MKQVCSLWSRTADILLQGCRLTQEASGLAWEPWKWQLLKKARNTNISPITGCMYASGKYFTTKKIWQARKQSQSTQKHNKKRTAQKSQTFPCGIFTSDAVGLHWAAVPVESHYKDMAKCLESYVPSSRHCVGGVRARCTEKTFSF